MHVHLWKIESGNCDQGEEYEEHYVVLCKVMKYENQWCLGLFLLELKGHREKLLKDNNTATQSHQKRTITAFFSPNTLAHATSQSRSTQMLLTRTLQSGYN